MYDILYNPTENRIEGYKQQFNIPRKIVTPYVEPTVAPEPIVTPEPAEETEPIEVQIDIKTPEKHGPFDALTLKSQETQQKSKRYNDRNQFLSELTAAYTKALSMRGINPEYAKYLAVQDAHESAFGSKYTGNYNFGNITVGSSKRNGTIGNDTDANGRTIKQNFRDYDNLDDYINDKINLLNGKRYKAFTGDISGFYDRVKAGGYATAKDYVSNLKTLFNQYYPVAAKYGIKLNIWHV